MNTTKAILSALSDRGRELLNMRWSMWSESNVFGPSTEWRLNALAALRAAVGPDHRLVDRYQSLDWKSSNHGVRKQAVGVAVGLLEDAINEIDLLRGADEARSGADSGEVFIVHGHNHQAKVEVARTLEKLLGRDVVILHEQADRGLTLVEKLEHHGHRASFAVILLTADDAGGTAASSETLNPRARQNVILEAGWFLARLGRQRVVLLYEPTVELPSDLRGLLYKEFNSDGSWRYELGRELRAAGFDADVNKL